MRGLLLVSLGKIVLSCWSQLSIRVQGRWLDSITDSMAMNLSNSRKLQRAEEPGVLQSVGSWRARGDLATEQQ